MPGPASLACDRAVTQGTALRGLQLGKKRCAITTLKFLIHFNKGPHIFVCPGPANYIASPAYHLFFLITPKSLFLPALNVLKFGDWPEISTNLETLTTFWLSLFKQLFFNLDAFNFSNLEKSRRKRIAAKSHKHAYLII